jgi:S1-C subfamily serine protease
VCNPEDVKKFRTAGFLAATAAFAALAASYLLPIAGAADTAAAIQGIVDVDTVLGKQDSAAAGTGIVLTSSGEILTNNHVIRGATRVKVTDLDNNKTYTGKVVGYSVSKDVAVIQLQNASGLKVAPIGDSSTARVGDAVSTYGNAEGAGGAPGASGKITGIGKSVTANGEGTSETLTGMIETDSQLQPGDSGGPMVNASGQVIGMDTAAGTDFSFTGTSSTHGFAIPINYAKSLAAKIVAGQASSTIHIGATAFLGVGLEPTDDRGFFNQTSSGLTIADVVSGSPSAKAGLTEFDVITRFDGKAVSTQTKLTSLILAKSPGDTVKITFQDQDGQTQTASVKLASGPPQ